MPYEIQHNTLTDGWTNTWLFAEDDGVLHRETFATAAEAEAALDEYLYDLQEAYYAGQMEAYDSDDYRIRFVQCTEAELNNQPTGETP